ncbi:MAG: tetratricopeptide repeat protein, partial [Gammaproteobacteria bacterium]|nr:tetratricopeptide repeat protein [Gammaproteobacteria bacterium]
LGVAHELEGSVRQSGIMDRITAQLIDTETGFHLWSETFDRELNDIFAIQDEISASVGAALKVTLFGEAGRKVVNARGTDSVEAYDLYLRGRYLREHISNDNIQQSIAVLHEAVAVDPDYAAAWAQLALSQHSWVSAFTESLQFGPGYSIARRYAERALALDDRLAEAYIALGAIQWAHDFDLEGSERSLLRALELEPNNVDALVWYGSQMALIGRFDIALEACRKAVELDPLSMAALGRLAVTLTIAGSIDESTKFLRRMLEIDPDVARIHGRIAYNLLLQGKLAEAEAEYEKEPVDWVRDYGKILLLRRSEDHDAWTTALEDFIREYGKKDAYQIAEIYADAGDPDAAFEWLDNALEVRDPGLVWIKTDTLLSSLHDDSRWQKFLDKVFNSS